MERQLCDRTKRFNARQRRNSHRPQADVTLGAYTFTVDEWKNSNEDERGVDIGQIRALVKLTVAERVREMVHAANVLMTIQENARRFRELQSR